MFEFVIVMVFIVSCLIVNVLVLLNIMVLMFWMVFSVWYFLIKIFSCVFCLEVIIMVVGVVSLSVYGYVIINIFSVIENV